MEAKTHISQHRILELLDYVKDPEARPSTCWSWAWCGVWRHTPYLADDRWTGFPADRLNQ